MYNYDIHGITTVISDVRLPELTAFLTQKSLTNPNICVHVGKLNGGPIDPQNESNADYRFIRYDEKLGTAGFGAEIEIYNTDSIDVRATSILRHSPHVLYTNLVEPILRWNFVEKGYSLVHGACIAYGDDAYMITARTDTGKTTTILRILDENEHDKNISFISDDLTLVSPDGEVMTYPKPLTISYHTVAAINSPRLSKKERMFLPIQSRLHSRSGRLLALFLAKTKLPMATVNTFTQLVVPPPKYHVDYLVPHVNIAQRAKLAGLFVIERGGVGEEQVDHEEAMEILLSNCDDAYGFPPYDSLEEFLRTTKNGDLRDTERTIVTQAFENLPTVLLRSETFDWSERIPGLIGAAAAPLSVQSHSALLPSAAGD